MRLRLLSALVLVLLLIGCTTSRPPAVLVEVPPGPQEDPFQVFPDTYRTRALAYEKKGELQQALFAWKIVASFRPDDPEGLEKIEQLQKCIQNVAGNHFQEGLGYLNNRSLQAARKEFLLVLAYDRENVAALEYLKTKTIEPDYTSYEIRQGDTISGIAKKISGDPKRDVLIAYFNDLTSNDQLRPGMVLKLPILEAEPKREVRLEAKRENKNKPRTASPPKIYDKARAEEHYRKGVNYFLAEDLQGAIKEWEETLRLYPEHPNAKRDIEKARSLLLSMGSK